MLSEIAGEPIGRTRGAPKLMMIAVRVSIDKFIIICFDDFVSVKRVATRRMGVTQQDSDMRLRVLLVRTRWLHSQQCSRRCIWRE